MPLNEISFEPKDIYILEAITHNAIRKPPKGLDINSIRDIMSVYDKLTQLVYNVEQIQLAVETKQSSEAMATAMWDLEVKRLLRGLNKITTDFGGVKSKEGVKHVL